MQSLLKIVFTTLHILFLPLTIPFVLFLFAYKQIVCACAKLFRNFEGPVFSSSCIFLPDKLWTRPHSAIVGVLDLEGTCTVDDIANLFQEAYDKRNDTGQRCYRELAFYPVYYFGYVFWQKSTNFKISNQFRLLEVSSTNETEFITSVVENLHRKPFSKHQPLWDAHLLQNVCGNPTRNLFFLRFHHLLADGMSFVKFFHVLTGSETLPRTFTKPEQSYKMWKQISCSSLTKLYTFINMATTGFVEYFYTSLFDYDKNPLNFDLDGNPKMTGNWICSLSKPLNVDELKHASRNWNCSIVHFLLCAVSNGLEQYIAKYHAHQPKPKGVSYIASLPIPGHPDLKLCNYWCLAKIRTQFGMETKEQKIQYFKEESVRSATDIMPVISTFMFQYLVGIFPRWLLDEFTNVKGTGTVILSNVVGPQDKTRLFAGCKVNSKMTWAAIPHESMALAVVAISCNGELRLCLKADLGCIQSRDRLEDLTQLIEQEFETFCEKEEKFDG